MTPIFFTTAPLETTQIPSCIRSQKTLEVLGSQRWVRSKVTIIVGENPPICEPKSGTS
jgi:hypothetical protein